MTEAIATEESFPVSWTSPEDPHLSWWHERWHLPDPIGPLAFDYAYVLYNDMNRGRRARGDDGALRARRINTYVYVAFGPSHPDDPAPIGTEPQPDRLENHAMWDSLWLPEIRRYLGQWEAFDHASATAGELLRHIDDSMTWLARGWEIHGRLDFGADALFALMDDVLGWTREDAADLVLGAGSKSLEGDAALRDLAMLAADAPVVRSLVLELPPDRLFEALSSEPGAASFLGAFDRYLHDFGRRSDNFHDISVPTWIEDVSSPLALLKLHVREPAFDAGAAARTAEDKRDAAQQRARGEFAERAPDRLDEFERELALGLRGNALNEDHNYWLDQQVMYWGRMDMLAAGDRLASAGVIAERDDVFMLTLTEVRAALAGDTTDLGEVVRAAHEELDRWAPVSPPTRLGAPMAPEMQAGVATMFGQFESTSTDAQVRGQSASPGVVTGVARIIASLDDSHRLNDGEVLVAQTTSPPWTPLFGIAAAVVTDAGGPMSHVAIVAREYGIPAVVGTVDATRKIRDGQRVRVDGSAGTVDLLED